MLSIKKFLGEAMPVECKVILGWLLDTRRLSIELPEDKHAAWTRSIERILGPSVGVSHSGDGAGTLIRIQIPNPTTYFYLPTCCREQQGGVDCFQRLFAWGEKISADEIVTFPAMAANRSETFFCVAATFSWISSTCFLQHKTQKQQAKQSTMSNNSKAPGPFLQRLNELLHQEPFSFLFYGLYWFIVLFFLSPFMGVLVVIQTAFKLARYLLGLGTPLVDPNKDGKELAVIITGSSRTTPWIITCG